MKILINVPEEIYKASKIVDVQYEDVVQIPLEVIANGTPIPDNATNGDVIKAMFPNGTTAKFCTFLRFIDGEHYFDCSEDWWNAPYQKGGNE